MFKSIRVPCFLNGFSGHGDDAENKEMKLSFHVNPIWQELAAEVSPYLADRIFRKDEDGEWVPVKEVSKAVFASIAIPMQNVAFDELPDIDEAVKGVRVDNVTFLNLRASRQPDSDSFRLEFDAIVPMDGDTIRLVKKFYKSTVFLTTEAVQMPLPLDAAQEDAQVTVALQDAADAEEPTTEAPKKQRRPRRQPAVEV